MRLKCGSLPQPSSLELGKLSSGKAAAMAGLGRVTFLHKLGANGFYAINLQDEQIEAELNAATELAP